MNFATKPELEALLLNVKKLGTRNVRPSAKQISDHIQFHEFYVIASTSKDTKACGVTVSADGRFLASLVDTSATHPVSYIRGNFHEFRNADLSDCDVTLEDVRKAFCNAVPAPMTKAA